MSTSKVSVIIPCFNREKFLPEAIESVLNQTYSNIELLTIDDGSTDGTREILSRFQDRGVTLLEHPGRINKGQSASINLGLSLSKGEYIAILDSDDYWDTQKIEKQVRFLESNPDIGLVYGNGYGVDEKGNPLYRIYEDGHTEHSNPCRVLMDCYFLVPNNALIRKSVLDQTGGFDETMRAAQDHDMAIRIAEVTPLGYLNETLFYYRRHPDSISNTRADQRWKTGFIILDKARKRYPYPNKIIRKRRAVLHFRMGQCLMEKKHYLRAGIHYLAAGILDLPRAISVLTGSETVTSPH